MTSLEIAKNVSEEGYVLFGLPSSEEVAAATAKLIMREYAPSSLSDRQKMVANIVLRDGLNEAGSYFVHD